MGPAAQVAAVMAAVNARAPVEVEDPTDANDVVMRGNVPVGESRYTWFRMAGGAPQILHMVRCEGEVMWRTQWMDVNADGSPAPRPADFLPALRDSVRRRIPMPVPRVAPADEHPDGWTYAQLDTYFWVEQAAGQWETVSATASVPGLSVTVSAEPERLIVHPGDGGGPVVCEGPQPAIRNDEYYEGMPGCRYRYRNSSAMAPNGATFPLQMEIEWRVTWSASNGRGGDLGVTRTTSEVRDLAVAELQAVVVDHSPG